MAAPFLCPAAKPATARHRSPASFLFVTVVAVLLAATACAGEKNSEQAIRALIDREVQAMNSRSLSPLAEIWSTDPDISLFDVPPPGRFEGWERIGRVFKSFFDRCTELHLAVDQVRVHVDGAMGYATYDWIMTGRMGDFGLDDRGQATAIYRRGADGWRLVHLHYSPAPPALAAGAPDAAPDAPAALPPAPTPAPR